MAAVTDTISARRRYLFMLLGITLFLPPLSIAPQTAGEVNMCGVVCPRMFFIVPSRPALNAFIDNFRAMWFGATLVGLILLVTLFFGRLWCSHVCPIGGASELIGRLLPRRWKIDFSFLNAPAFRYGYFFVYVAGAFLGLGGIACKLCSFRVIPFLAGAPFVPAYRTYLLTWMGIAGLVTVALTGFFARGGRTYCNLLCPVGALDALSNRLGANRGRRMRVDHERCVGCGACRGVCPTSSIEVGDKARIDHLSCMPCGICGETCPKEAISYGKNKI